MQRRTMALSNVAGSLRAGLPASVIGDNEYSLLENFYQYESILKKRPAAHRLTLTSIGSAIQGIFAQKTSLGVWRLLIGFGTGVARLDGTGFTTLAISDGRTYSSADYRWTFVQYNDYIVCARRGIGGTLKHSDGASFIEDGGIATPLTAPTLGNGAAGSILAGDYYGVVVYRDSATGAISAISPVSALYTAPGGDSINWSAIPVSPNGRVDVKDLYRTLRGQTGAYYYVATVPNAQTTYTGDDLLTAQMGDAASLTEGPPPDNIECVVGPWKERLACHDGVNVYLSNYLQMESFDVSTKTFPISPDDGHRITGLWPWGDRLFIGKTNGIWLLSSPDGSSFKLSQVDTPHGCFAHHSIQQIDGGALIWWGGDDFYIMQPGGVPQPIGTSKLGLSPMSLADSINISAAVIPEKNWYVVNVTPYAYIYNYRTDVWTKFSYRHYVTQSGAYAYNSLQFIASIFDSDNKRALYATFRNTFAAAANSFTTAYGNLFDLMYTSAQDDDAVPILCDAIGKAITVEDGFLHSIANILLDTPSVGDGSTLYASIYRDIASSAFKTRQITPIPGGWVAARLSSFWYPSYYTRIGLSYSGEDDFSIRQLSFDVIPSAHRRRFSR